jgi:hypothetical protein
MPTLIVVLLGLLMVSGCAKGSGDAAHTTGPTAVGASEGVKRVSADLRDGFLSDHNASFNDGRTFRWVTPIPIFVITPEPAVTNVVLEQFMAWESALGGAGGSPFYAPQQVSPRRVPRRGIFFTEGDLPGAVVGRGDPTVVFGESRRSAGPRDLRTLVIPAAPRRMEMPEILASGEIQRCLITLDPALQNVSEGTIKAVIRHEVGHCLGFIGHVASGLMKPTCCALNFTSDVVGMMKKLYNLPPGTEVTR